MADSRKSIKKEEQEHKFINIFGKITTELGKKPSRRSPSPESSSNEDGEFETDAPHGSDMDNQNGSKMTIFYSKRDPECQFCSWNYSKD